MTDREKTFSEELPHFKERMKEISDNYDNPDGYADVLYLSALSDSNRIVRKAEEEINRQQAEIVRLKKQIAEVSKTIKSEAIEEFAKRLKEKSYKAIRNYGLTKDVVEVCDIDNLVKEVADRLFKQQEKIITKSLNKRADLPTEKGGNGK